ncbi:MAG: hypothetical protein WAV08_10555 [Desulfobacterales bacterium]|jgi:hypothetical protein
MTHQKPDVLEFIAELILVLLRQYAPPLDPEMPSDLQEKSRPS